MAITLRKLSRRGGEGEEDEERKDGEVVKRGDEAGGEGAVC